MSLGFDCATKLNESNAKKLKKAGYNYALRYLGDSWKSFSKAEAAAIQKAGLDLCSIYQDTANHASYFRKSQGEKDGKQATIYAANVNQPKGSVIYFAVDYDTSNKQQLNAIKNYFAGVKSTITKDYKVGVYGSYTVIEALKGLVDYYWQTYAWSNGKISKHAYLRQYHNNVTIHGVTIDKNEAYVNDIGQWSSKAEKIRTSKESNKVSNRTYTVQSGDTLSGIASKYKIMTKSLQNLNNISNPEGFHVKKRIER